MSAITHTLNVVVLPTTRPATTMRATEEFSSESYTIGDIGEDAAIAENAATLLQVQTAAINLPTLLVSYVLAYGT